MLGCLYSAGGSLVRKSVPSAVAAAPSLPRGWHRWDPGVAGDPRCWIGSVPLSGDSRALLRWASPALPTALALGCHGAPGTATPFHHFPLQWGARAVALGSCISPPPPPSSSPALRGTRQVSREASGPAGSDICFVTYAAVTKKRKK